MRKRERFIISSILLALGLLASQFVSGEIRYVAIGLFFIATYFISGWALNKNLNGIEWITIVPFPAYYALSVSLFYFLLPSNIFSRILILGLFGVGMYATYLMSNIYAVGKIKTIQLLRAAHAVGSLFLFLMCMFIFNFIFSLKLFSVWNALLVGISAFVPLLSAIWAVDIQPTIPKHVVWLAGLFSLFLAEIAFGLSFLPVGLWTASLYLTSLVYIGFGIIQSHLIGRLFTKTLREYSLLAVFVTVSLILLIDWK